MAIQDSQEVEGKKKALTVYEIGAVTTILPANAYGVLSLAVHPDCVCMHMCVWLCSSIPI